VRRRLAAGAVFSLAALARLLVLPRYDLILVSTGPPASPAAAQVLRWLRRTPYVYLIHDLYPDVAVCLKMLRPEARITRLCARAQRDWLLGAARVVAIGRYMRDFLVSRYGVPPERVSVITNWADPDEVPCLPKTTRFREQNGLSGFVVLYAGNLGRCQDFDIMLDAARELQVARPEVTFVFVGTGPKRSYIEQRVACDGARNVRVMPFVPAEDFADLLASADLSLVLLEPGAETVGVPSKFYNILASGRPTLAVMGPDSEVGRVLNEERCGFHLSHGDVAGVVQVIEQLAENPGLAAAMGDRARQAFEQAYTLQHAAAQYYRLFREVVGETDASAS
jgi:glycosyltransferase involved in cell wall biosynthesis